MELLKRISSLILSISLLGLAPNPVKAAHIIGGDIYWECVTTGADAGKVVFYLTLYRDCSVNTQLSVTDNSLELFDEGANVMNLPLTLQSQTDATPPGCGFSCADELENISVEKFVFASDPVELNFTPGPSGLEIVYRRCCRNPVDNLVNAENQEIYYSATMYPYNGQNLTPCYDSSPQFAELPTSFMCSGYELRYNSDAVDTDLDSLSYELVPALGTEGEPIPYNAGYSGQIPLPGSALDPSYDDVTMNPVTGQLEYDAPSGLAGRWTVVAAVTGWRCGQRISRNIREMSVTVVPCPDPNNPPVIDPIAWNTPAGATGYEITVEAGDLVNFTISGEDPDVTGGTPQELTLTASGAQFGNSFTDANAGCLNTPCATLSNTVPPTSGNGTLATTFNWQTTCDHVGGSNGCANFSNTYNFLFKFRDDFCPANSIRTVNVAVTVLGEPVVDSPQPHCVDTDPSTGDITLTWTPSTDNNNPPSFVEYVIEHSTSPNGPFQEVATIPNIGTDTYVHNAANAVAPPTTTGANYYLIRTRSGCGGDVLSAPFDTVSSIYLTLTNSGETADLSWTPIASPPLPTSNGNGQGLYQVYREYPAGVWEEIGTTFDPFYSDPVIWCDEQVNYQVRLTDNLPCVSNSNIVGDVLDNPAEPDPQPIDSVWVDPVTGFITVCWSPNPSLNVVQYNIYRNPNQFAWLPADTVYGYNTTCWVDPVSDPQNVSMWYQVTATNNCEVEGLPGGDLAQGTDYHQNILVEAQYDSCLHQTRINWNRYRWWEEGVREYDVYTAQDGNDPVKLATVNDTLFLHEDMEIGGTYCYFVRAVRDVPQRLTAVSNQRCVTANVPKRPDYQYHYNSTVNGTSDAVESYFFVDSTAAYLGFDIQRGTEPDALNSIWFVPFDPETRFYEYTDNTARPDLNSYYYQVIGVDSCELNADTLNMTRTIHLEAEANPDRTNTITWNPYEGWTGQIIGYNIYRSVDGVYDFRATVPPTQLTFTDSVEEIIRGEGNFCYYVEAMQSLMQPIGTVDPVSFQEVSRSNEACAPQPPNVFVPNAFMPEGVNSIFKPVTVYVGVSDYVMQIYNRWGARIFESNDPDLGWDGTTAGGKEAPQGTYGYMIRFTSAKGDSFTKSGTVTLLR